MARAALLADGVDVDVATGDQRHSGGACCRPVARFGCCSANASVDMADDRRSEPLYACEIGLRVTQLLAANAGGCDRPRHNATVHRLRQGHTEIVVKLLAANASVDLATTTISSLDAVHRLPGEPHRGRQRAALCEPSVDLAAARLAPLAIAAATTPRSSSALLAADASVDRRHDEGTTRCAPASAEGRTEIVAKLLVAGASVDQADDEGDTPMRRILPGTSTARPAPRRRQPRLPDGRDAPRDTAEGVATYDGHHDITAWLLSTRLCSTALHHLEVLTAARARAAARRSEDRDGRPLPDAARPRAAYSCRAAPPPTRRRASCSSGPRRGTGRRTARRAVRDRVIELMVVGQRIKRHPNDFPILRAVGDGRRQAHRRDRDAALNGWENRATPHQNFELKCGPKARTRSPPSSRRRA